MPKAAFKWRGLDREDRGSVGNCYNRGAVKGHRNSPLRFLKLWPILGFKYGPIHLGFTHLGRFSFLGRSIAPLCLDRVFVGVF